MVRETKKKDKEGILDIDFVVRAVCIYALCRCTVLWSSSVIGRQTMSADQCKAPISNDWLFTE